MLENQSSWIFSHSPLEQQKYFLKRREDFSQAGLNVPAIKSQDSQKGFLLQEDLGDHSLEKQIQENKTFPLTEYFKALEQLIILQKNRSPFFSQTKPKPFCFTKKQILNEMYYTEKYLIYKWLDSPCGSKLKKAYLKEWDIICEKIANYPQVVGHRDFHSRNLFVKNKKIYVIDFQDAGLFPRFYDAVSLIYDVYVDSSMTTQIRQRLLDYFISKGSFLSESYQTEEIALTAIQRLFKAVGRFAGFYCLKKQSTHLKYIYPALKMQEELLQALKPKNALSEDNSKSSQHHRQHHLVAREKHHCQLNSIDQRLKGRDKTQSQKTDEGPKSKPAYPFFLQLTQELLKKIPVFIFCIFCLYPFEAPALQPQGLLALSMSGAGRAITKGAEYHLLNPASLIHYKGTQGSGFYMFGHEDQKPYWGLSLVENQQIPLGLSYLRQWDGSDQYLSLSTAGFIVPGWSVGLSLSRWEVGINPNSATKSTSKKQKTKAYWNVQAGVLIRPEKSPLSIGAVYDHILPLKGAFKEQRRWALAFSFEIYRWLKLRADVLHNTQSQWTVAGGAEALVSGFLTLRLANRYNFKDEKWLFSGGLGLTAQSMALDYGLSQTPDTKAWQHTVGVQFAF